MLDKLQEIKDRYIELSDSLSDPEVLSDSKKLQNLMKEQAQLEPIVFKYDEYMDVRESLEESKEMLMEKLEDDFKELVKEEIKDLTAQEEELESQIKILLLPTDPNDDKDVIVEIRAGVGGDEAGLFAGDLFRMYLRYAERKGWKTDILSESDQGVGGYKEVIFSIKGKGAFSKLKYESGVHRVQRVPDTESSGRIHTSSATVAVLPEVDDIDIELNTNDVRVDVFRASGNGGQHVNTTDSAVRLTHLPTGIVVSCQDGKSQLKNKEKAFKVLKAKLYDTYLQEQTDELAQARKSQVGSGDRSERIRTYNFPQGRVSDHRINLTLHKLDAFLDGDLTEMLEALVTSDQAEKLRNVSA